MKTVRKIITLAIGALVAGWIGSPLMATTIDYTFTYDVSQFDDSHNFATGDSLTINFNSGTDFYNVTSADIYSFQYNLAAGPTEIFYRGGGWIFEDGNIGDHFSFDGQNLTITYDNTGGDYLSQYGNDPAQFGQISGGILWHAYTTLSSQQDDAYLSLTGDNTVAITGTTASVPEGGSVVLYVGIICCGMVVLRRRFVA